MLGASVDSFSSWIFSFLSSFLLEMDKIKIPFPMIIPRFYITEGRITQFVGFGARILDFFGDRIEYLFGPRVWLVVVRIVVGLPFLYAIPAPYWCKKESVVISGVDCLLYTPISSLKKSDGLLVFIHGGGWCFGKPQHFESIFFSLVNKLGIQILAIDYKLAPEKVFPFQLDECEKVVKSVHDEDFDFLPIDKSKIVLMGDSAGGNLAAVTAQRLLRQGLSHYIACQVLIYPITNLTDFQTPSYQYYERKYRSTAIIQPRIFVTLMMFYLGIYPKWGRSVDVLLNKHISRDVKKLEFYQKTVDHKLIPPEFRRGDFYDHPEHPEPNPELVEEFEPFILNPEVNPLLAKDLEGLPEALIATCGFDILRDDGVLYVKKLESHGVPVQWKHYNAVHGILAVPVSKHRRVMMADLVAFLKNKI
uniref:Alpha/beta hydrolase fold-3 domain-containing protein n=1 Tax=Panagrolaimus sp. JU765 TaxID=591449 RepID=A0AC34QX52_9BILA